MTEYEEEFRKLFGDSREGSRRAMGIFYSGPRRYDLVTKYSFAVLTSDAIEKLKKYGPIIEIGAGNGYWAYEMRKAGVDIIATEIGVGSNNEYNFVKPWTDLIEMEAIEAARKYSERALMSVWPCYDKSWAWKALMAYKGDTFIYVGEGPYGCTGDDNLHAALSEEGPWNLVETVPILRWHGLHDTVNVYKRNT